MLPRISLVDEGIAYTVVTDNEIYIEMNRHLCKYPDLYLEVLKHELKQLKKEPIAIIDDLTVREIANTFEIPVIGTVGVLLRSVEEKYITKEKCKNLFEKLVEETDFRIATKLYSQILKKLAEF